MVYMRSAKFIKEGGMWSVKVPMNNGLIASVIELAEDGYLVNINHPLTQQRVFSDTEEVDKYLIAMAKLGVDDES